jgi:hypothetical protein
VQVRAADAATVDLNDEVVGAGRGILDGLHSGIVWSGNDYCAHHDPFSKVLRELADTIIHPHSQMVGVISWWVATTRSSRPLSGTVDTGG